MKRREFIKTASLAAGATLVVPYILPSGRLFAATGSRLANHVVYVLFAGGIRNQESVDQLYISTQGLPTQGNIMENMLPGNRPTSNLVYDQWSPIVNNPLSQSGTLFKELRYAQGPTGHFNGHTVAMTGNYSFAGTNLTINPTMPTIFEYYRKHSDPQESALNAWWLSEGLGPYPALNYSQDPNYGPMYGANYMHPATIFGDIGPLELSDAEVYQPDDVARIEKLRKFMNNSFENKEVQVPGIINTADDRERIKDFIRKVQQGIIPFDFPTPTGTATGLTGDLLNIGAAWKVLEEFAPELMVINTFNLDVCHSNFSGYIQNLHKADYGIGWLWNKIQSDPVLANDTIMVCVPEHGRNLDPNSIRDTNGLSAIDHTSDDNSRRVFSLIIGPNGVVKQNQSLGTTTNPIGESIDIVPTIAHILGIKDDIPGGMLPGRVLQEAFV